MTAARVGIMGFGRVGREFYRLAEHAADIDVVVVADVAEAEVLWYLLNSEPGPPAAYRLEGNYLQGASARTRMVRISDPHEVPWDAFGVELVVEATGRYRTRARLNDHLANGAGRVLLASLPDEALDRMVIYGLNESDAQPDDRLICGGSQTTTAFALMVRTLDEVFGLEHASMTTVHAFTSDQPAQDYAADAPRRSRSAAKNIIPNQSASPRWVEFLMPRLAGRLSGHALNVPVQKGSLLDVTAVVKDREASADAVNESFARAAEASPAVLAVTDEPIVSSDVIDETRSLVIDTKATLQIDPGLVKVLGWYDARGHASRLLDLVRVYHNLGARQ